MSYSIIGFGSIGKALAKAFARKGISVSVAATRDPSTFASEAAAIGPKVAAKRLAEAVEADVIFLAVGFQAYPDVAKTLSSWKGKTIVDTTNAYGAPEVWGEQPASKAVEQAFKGAKLVKGFNHLPARLLAQDPAVADGSGRRVVFLSSDDNEAATEIGALATKLGYAPIQLGGLAQGGLLVEGRGNSWGPLIFKDLSKLE